MFFGVNVLENHATEGLQIGLLHYNWPISAHASQALSMPVY